ncbi:phosphocarrier protein HPr [Lysinibacillus contaminans]|uniref:Phosphocarrier protein HPr n=1 Tax=Lysinibacillus contaminans TaxID=1293441 RepID=A0ABR5JZG7_9BACI|nr:HPr family phosphocarrier protein [Lysinibacillus contaminans]KOS67900.1 phosphocarrier protein HPr [Lysinibacillus contaminans]
MKKTYKITSSEGLHARPTTLLVTAVTPFASEVTMTYKDKTVNLKSIMGVMALGVASGSVVDISAEGPDAKELLDKVTEVIISNGIGEEC